MANERYEGVGPNGHYTLSERIFTKIKNLFDTKVKTDVPANAVFTDTNTTYTLSTDTANNKIKLTPSSGSVQSITVPFATNATNATKATQDASGDVITTTYRKLSNNDFDTINVTELNAGDLIVTGVGRFTNGLYGNLTGNASSATQVNNNLKIQLNGGTTEGTNQFTYNGSTAKSLNITKSSIGLGNVENKSSATIRGELTSTNVTGALGFTPLNAALKGANSGVAELDSAGKVPSSQLPSFVDDVLEYASLSNFPTTGESGKIYVAIDTNKTYRWGGSAYAEISPSLALGTTSTTAYYGDKGKVAYDHATETRLTTATTSGLYKVASTKEGHIASLTSVVKSDITALGIPGSDTNTTYSLSASGESVVLTGSDSSSKSVSLGTQLLPNLPIWTANPTDDVYLIRRDTAGDNAYGQVKFSTVWNYIKSKADGTYVNVTGDTMSGNLAVTNVLGIAQTAGNVGGISLYGGTSNVDTYGIAFRLTSNKEKHGYVQGDWATYFTMNSGATTRGWVFRTNTTNGNVASISGGGNAVFNGSVTVGGNTTNTSGVRQVYNSTTKSLDFVFVA